MAWPARPGFGAHAVALAMAIACVAAPSSASEVYPEQLRAALDLAYVPSCTLCHSGSGGSASIVDTPFGKSMVERGLRAADGGLALDAGAIDPSLLQALDAMRRDGVDSDGDGAEDLDELSWQGDPNHPDGLKANATPSVQYGCHIAFPRHDGIAVSTMIFAMLGALGLGRAVRFRMKPKR